MSANSSNSGNERLLAEHQRGKSNYASISDLAYHLRDYSGYIREASLERCVQHGAVEALPYVVERLNDWVPNVRRAAQSAVLKLMPLASPPQLLGILPAVLQLREKGRADHTEWSTQFEIALVKQVGGSYLEKCALESDVKLARACFHILKSQELLEAASLTALMLKSREDIVLATHAITLCATLPLENQRTHYELALTSHFGSVRTLALRALLQIPELNADRDRIAVDALLDVQSSVRWLAIKHLQTRQFDLAAHYRGVLANPAVSAKRTQVALLSLATLKAVDELELIRSFTRAPLPSIRRAAFVAWLKLVEGDKDVVALQALGDEVRSIRKFALDMVRRLGAYIPFPSVRTILEDNGDLELLFMFAEHSKWIWLEALADLAIKMSTADALRPLLVQSLRRWCAQSGRMFDSATAQQVNFLISSDAANALELLAQGNQALKEVIERELTYAKNARVSGHS